ncbi:MAG: hypothetical protein WD205_07045 [Rhodothermales bacterium]
MTITTAVKNRTVAAVNTDFIASYDYEYVRRRGLDALDAQQIRERNKCVREEAADRKDADRDPEHDLRESSGYLTTFAARDTASNAPAGPMDQRTAHEYHETGGKKDPSLVLRQWNYPRKGDDKRGYGGATRDGSEGRRERTAQQRAG